MGVSFSCMFLSNSSVHTALSLSHAPFGKLLRACMLFAYHKVAVEDISVKEEGKLTSPYLIVHHLKHLLATFH